MRGVAWGEWFALLLVASLLALVLFGGCAHAGEPVNWQTLANQATTTLKVGPVLVDERDRGTNGLYFCREMRIQLRTNRRMLDVRRTLAHEIGHHVRRHCGEGLASEMEANAVAVEVLEAWGATHAQATYAVAQMIYAGRSIAWNGVHGGCAELHDFLQRFPDTQDPRAPGQQCS